MTELAVLAIIVLVAWALGQILERLKRKPIELVPPPPPPTPREKVEAFGGIPNKRVAPDLNSRCEICEGGFGTESAFHGGMANDLRLACSRCRDLMISVSRRSHAQNFPNADRL